MPCHRETTALHRMNRFVMQQTRWSPQCTPNFWRPEDVIGFCPAKRPKRKPSVLRGAQGSPASSHGSEVCVVGVGGRKGMGQAHQGVADETCCEWMTFRMRKGATHPKRQPHAGACDDL